MAWRMLMANIFSAAASELAECFSRATEGGGVDARGCAEILISAADALYSPLRPIDSGVGAARRLASRLTALLANAFLAVAREKLGEEAIAEVLKAVGEVLERDEKPHPHAKSLLEKAGVDIEPAWTPEPREALLNTLRDYVEPPQPRRRRREPRKPDLVRDMRRLLRDIGRDDPVLARSLHKLLEEKLGLKI